MFFSKGQLINATYKIWFVHIIPVIIGFRRYLLKITLVSSCPYIFKQSKLEAGTKVSTIIKHEFSSKIVQMKTIFELIYPFCHFFEIIMLLFSPKSKWQQAPRVTQAILSILADLNTAVVWRVYSSNF